MNDTNSACRSRVLFFGLMVTFWILGIDPMVSVSGQDRVDSNAELFRPGVIKDLKLELSKGAIAKIRSEERPYVRAELSDLPAKKRWTVGLKIKGAAGSTRDFEDKPALTVNSDKFQSKQLIYGLDKFHLNNSVQDDTYMHEWLSAFLFRKAGYPATRVSHAMLRIQDREPSLYVLKEGFDLPFLSRHFRNPNGNLYDGGFLQDIDAELEKDSGEGPDDRSDLQGIVEAFRDPNPASRWKRIEAKVDLDRFLTFMAMERMMAHWDGYSLQANNYRLYFDPTSRKGIFLPHGMDQMFGDPGMALFNHPRPMISLSVMQNNAWRLRYRERIRSLLPLFHPDQVIPELEKVASPVSARLESLSEDLAKEHRDRVEDLKNRIRARYENIQEQLEHPDPEPISFTKSLATLFEGWYGESEVEEVKHRESDSETEPTLEIENGPQDYCVASWRNTVLLGPGKYRFHARLRCEQVVEQKDGPELTGVGIRISGGEKRETLTGTSDWSKQHYDLEVREDRREVELVIELRCKTGKLVIDRKSLKLEKRP